MEGKKWDDGETIEKTKKEAWQLCAARCLEVENCYAWRWRTMEYHTEGLRKECALKTYTAELASSSSGYISGTKADCAGTAINHVSLS